VGSEVSPLLLYAKFQKMSFEGRLIQAGEGLCENEPTIR